ncbi:MAG: alanine/glycine:cation symporter family protein [Lachnospirales bacterium]
MNLEKLSATVCDIVWGLPLVIILLGAGLYFTVATNFVQFRHIKNMLKLLFVKNESSKGMSSFQAFALTVAGRVGTGNIAGVATAISLGGPGAMFWMWVIATVGSASSFIECTLGQVFKVEVKGEYRGGPAFYFEKVSGKKIFGILFALLSIISMAFFVPGVQSNSISSAIVNGFFKDSQNQGLIKLLIGVAVAILISLIFLGGTKRLSKVSQVVVPIMSIFYLFFALLIIIINIDKVPATFMLIIKEAFSPRAGLGGVIGTAVLNGVKRGIFSNESGQGTGPHGASAANVNHPAEQGLVQAFSVYFDTLLVCTATGLMILLTDSYNLINKSGELIYSGINAQGLEAGPAYTQAAISTLLGTTLGPVFVAIALFFFAFTTLMAYYYVAECNAVYLSIKKNPETGEVEYRKGIVAFTRLLIIISIIFFSFKSSTAVWNVADTGIGIMAWYNIIGILLIHKFAIVTLKDYDAQLKSGIEKPIFDSEKLGIKNVHIWEKHYEKKMKKKI